MKKWLAILLALVMVLSMFMLTACGEKAEEKEEEKQEEKNDETPNPSEGTPQTLTNYETVEAAAKKLETLTAADLTIKGEMKAAVNGQGMTITYTADCNIKLVVNEDKPVVGLTLKMVASDGEYTEEMALEAYYEDGYVYATSAGESFKTAVDLSELESELENALGEVEIDTEALPEFDLKDLLNKSALTKDTDGNSVLKIALELKDVQDAVDALMAELLKVMGSDEAIKMNVKEFGTELVLGAGYLSGVNLKAAIEAEIDGTVGTLELNGQIALNNPGQAVTITPPAGYESFPDTGEDSEETVAEYESF